MELALFDETVLVHRVDAFRFAYSLTKHSADAEDIVQQALLRAWRGFGRFDGRYPKTWLNTIVENCFRSEIRRKKSRPVLHDRSVDVLLSKYEYGGGFPVSWRSPSSESIVLDGLDEHPRLRAIFGVMNPDQVACLFLYSIQGFSQAEVSERLGVPVGTVRSRLFRGKKALRELLLESGLVDDLSV